jgi:hypothetical protein
MRQRKRRELVDVASDNSATFVNVTPASVDVHIATSLDCEAAPGQPSGGGSVFRATATIATMGSFWYQDTFADHVSPRQ